MVNIVVSGALGRMGKRIVELGKEDPECRIVGKLEYKANPTEGIFDKIEDVKDAYDCIIEFTSPEATVGHLKKAEKFRKAIVVGTTGLSEKDVNVIRKASEVIPIVFSPNMSIGVNVFFSLIAKAAASLDLNYGIKIREAHHIHKKDKPSGTAKHMLEIAKRYNSSGEIPVESIREDEIVGDHDITFESGVDTLKISHSAKTRDIFVLGALKAAKFIATKERGLFSMHEVLGL